MKKKILIIGSDHQNTLGIIRSFSNKKYEKNVIIHSLFSTNQIRCFKSRYLNGEKIIVQENENEILKSLIEFGKRCSEKIPLIPTNDYVELVIDSNLYKLQQFFYLPSIGNKQGEIVRMMDKYNQYVFSCENNIKMAKTIKINLKENFDSGLLKEIAFPCVVKPIISAFSKKSDIRFFNNRRELINSFSSIYQNYETVIVQEYIKKDFELCCFGCITDNKKCVYGTLKKIRYYPYEGGASLSFAELHNFNSFVLPFIEKLKSINYSGLFDFELLVINDTVMLNEINFRNSGNTWAIVNNGINAPLVWVESCYENIEPKRCFPIKRKYFMNETSDFRYVLDKKITIFKWFLDFLKTKTFNKFWIKDLKGSLVWYRGRKK